MGSVVLDGFRLVQFAQTSTAWQCYGTLFIVHTSLRLVFIFCQTLFIFKNHKVDILQARVVSKLHLRLVLCPTPDILVSNFQE